MGPARIARSSRWMLMAASLVAVAGLSSLLTVAGLRELAPDTISAELVDGHLRSLMAAQMTDVVSSDKHTVKPWFNGRITQSPRIVDLARQGFDLVGARVDVVDRMPVPTLVYRRRQHVISLTELAGEGRTGLSLRRGAEHGFNVVAWRDGNRSFVAISDLNATELEAFATSFQTAAE
jgi:anti-sigma factor RsiW